MQHKLKFVSMVLAGLLAACATPAASNPAAPSGPINSPIAAAPAQANNAPRGAPVIEIERSGGIAGKTEKTVVYANGELTLNEATTSQLGASAVQKWVADLDAAGFFALQGSYKSRCNDCFHVRVTVTNATQTKTVAYIEEVTRVNNVLTTIK
jgi:Fe-S cluster biogenesis protein NfuA